MIIRLNTANFSVNNIGELNKFTIFCHGSGLLSADFTSPADKGTNATIKVTTISADYGIDDIKVKMKSNLITPSIQQTGTNEYTITVNNVTGRIEVLVGEVASGSETGIINYSIPYTKWDWKSNLEGQTINADSFSIDVELGTAIVLGRRMNLSDTPFAVGDTVYFGIRDFARDGGNLSIVFFNGATEISRVNAIDSSPITYLKATVPENTTIIQIRIHGSVVTHVSGGKSYLSTVEFDENTEWRN